jgi:hypothetical protein
VLATLVVVFAASLVVAAGASNCHVEADGCKNTSDCGESIGPKPVRLQADGAHFYDCIFCALIDGQGRDDYTIVADSAAIGEAVTLTKQGGSWKASPSSAVALALPSPADDCGGRRLVFASADEFASHVQGRSRPDH